MIDHRGPKVRPGDDIGELEPILQQNGWTDDDLRKLSNRDVLAKMLACVRGRPQLGMPPAVIDSDRFPDVDLLPEGHYEVAEHHGCGQLRWDPRNIALYAKSEHEAGELIDIHLLQKEMQQKRALNLNVLQFLLANTTLIPCEWEAQTTGKVRIICFWGTLIRFISSSWERPDEILVPALVWRGRWTSGAFQLNAQNFLVSKHVASAYLVSS